MKLVALSAFLAVAAPTATVPHGNLIYTCDIDGEIGDLVAEYEIVSLSDTAAATQERLTGWIENGLSTVFYEGELSSPLTHYIFTGENEVAEFTDLATHERFLVRVVMDGDDLRLITHPDLPGSKQYLCKTAQS